MTEETPGAARTGSQGSDVSVPNVARIYDYLLGGKDNFAADRAAAGELLAAVPDAAVAARANRRFLGRAVWHLACDVGIRQFVNIGTGLPTEGNVHEIARAAGRSARVVYCDNDPLVVVHANALLADNLNVAAVQADLRQPCHLLNLPALHAHLDLDEPVAVLLVVVLHFIEDSEDPQGIVEAIKQHLAPGSFVVISHVTADEISADATRQATDVYQILATVLVGVLLDRVRWASRQQTAGLSGDVRGLLCPAVNVLGLLYGKVADMYASASIRHQINKSGLAPTIGTLWQKLGVGGPLS